MRKLLFFALLAAVSKAQTAETFLGIRFGESIASQLEMCTHGDDILHTLTTTTPCREQGNETDTWVVRNKLTHNYPLWASVRSGRVVELETNFDPDADTKTFINALTTKFGAPKSIQHISVTNLLGAHLPAVVILWKDRGITATLYSRGRAMDLGYFTVMTNDELIRRSQEAKAEHNRLDGKF